MCRVVRPRPAGGAEVDARGLPPMIAARRWGRGGRGEGRRRARTGTRRACVPCSSERQTKDKTAASGWTDRTVCFGGMMEGGEGEQGWTRALSMATEPRVGQAPVRGYGGRREEITKQRRPRPRRPRTPFLSFLFTRLVLHCRPALILRRTSTSSLT